MVNELLKWIIDARILVNLASIAILLLRQPLRYFFCARIAYQIWFIFPLSLLPYLLAHFLPKSSVLAQPFVQFMQSNAPAVESSESSFPFFRSVWSRVPLTEIKSKYA